MANAGYETKHGKEIQRKRKMSGPGGRVDMDHGIQLYIHAIPIQQLVLGAKGNFIVPEVE